MKLYRASLPAADTQKNVLIVVFDAWSARHVSLHGYSRETTPNLRRIADRAIVYNQHYAASDFTTPGTASLFTGVLPWAHRAFQLRDTLAPPFRRKTIFRAFNHYHRVVYSHNSWIYTLCNEFEDDLDEYVPQNRLMLTGRGPYDALFAHDPDISSVAWERAMHLGTDHTAYSLLLSSTRDDYLRMKMEPLEQGFPVGVPSIPGVSFFLLEHAIDWLRRESGSFPAPYLAYIHMLPPHDPYSPPEQFYRYFAGDGFRPPVKPVHPLTVEVFSTDELLRRRREYDEFILYVDREFGRLFNTLESSGALDNTWIILTSDHGELLERGYAGHVGPLLYEPMIRVPLMIFEPGRRERLDIHTPTSAVDLLPTLLHVTGQPAADWTEGSLLPPFGEPEQEHPVIAVYVADKNPRMPITHGAAAMRKGNHKLIYMFGYPELGDEMERVELYNLESDGEELDDLAASHREMTDDMLQDLKARIQQADQRYL